MNKAILRKGVAVSASALIAIFASPALYGSDKDAGVASTSYIDELRNQSGAKQKKITGGKIISDEKGQVDDSLYDVVIYNDIWDKSSHDGALIVEQYTSKGKTGTIALALPATELANAEIKAEMEWNRKQEEEAKKQEEEAKKIPSYYVGGYCSVNTPVKIVRSSEFTILNCLLNFGEGEYRHADVFAGVYPNYKKETLTVLPLYATLDSGKKVSLSGVVLTGDKGSLNIADHIERFKIRKLVAEYGLSINDVAYKYANAFMTQLIMSRTQTQVDYIAVSDPTNPNNNNSVVPIVTQGTLPPAASDYFIMAGIELVSQLFAMGAKNLMDDSDPLFVIYKGKRVYVEGIVTADNKGMASKFGQIEEETRKKIETDNNNYDTRKREVIDRANQSLMMSGQSSGRTQGGIQTIQQGYQGSMSGSTGGGAPIVSPASPYSR